MSYISSHETVPQTDPNYADLYSWEAWENGTGGWKGRTRSPSAPLENRAPDARPHEHTPLTAEDELVFGGIRSRLQPRV